MLDQLDHTALRPLERRVLQLSADGVGHDEIARRFRRSPEFIGRVMDFARLPGRTAYVGEAAGLRPLERRILDWRARGADYADIGPRFDRSADFVARVEDFARYKLAQH